MSVSPFTAVLEASCTRHGAAAVEARLLQPKGAADLVATGDDRYLSQMSLRIFRAGLKHSVVDAKWPAFEEVFYAFDPRRVRAMPDEALEALLGDTRLIRHWAKIKAVRDNAAAMLEVAAEHGSFGRWLADWPADDVVGLWEALGKRFSQMGGNSGPMFLRMVGKDTFCPVALGRRRVERVGRHRQAAEKPRRPPRRPGGLQHLGQRNRASAVAA